MTSSIGFLQLTLYHSGTIAFLRCREVCSFYRKPENDYTTVYVDGNNDFFMVRETTAEIIAQIEDINPDLR